jgi:hypothetical protein
MENSIEELKLIREARGNDTASQFKFYRDIVISNMTKECGFGSVDDILNDDCYTFIKGTFPNNIISIHRDFHTASTVIYEVDEETLKVKRIYSDL